ncbi:MAG: SprT-like domain-containing protein [Xanthomonadales bacterium]|nr:SprT-like domain-containing protein [Xanthomonadales bacterium]
MSIEELSEEIRRLSRLWDEPSLVEAQIEYSTRMTTSLGLAYPQRDLVRLNAALQADPVALKEVLTHELAHLVIRRRHGRRAQPHGPQWQRLMREAGLRPTVRMEVSAEVKSGMRPRAGFLHRCPVCAVERATRSRMRHWRCAICVRAGRSGRLQITRLESDVSPASDSEQS